MSVQKYIRVAAHFKRRAPVVPSVCCARGCHGNWNPASVHFILFPSRLLQQQSPCYSPSPYLDPSAPFNISYSKDTMTEICPWLVLHNSSDITITLNSTFYASLCSKFYAWFLNCLAVVLDLIFCLRKRTCMVRCP
jgi:hypothetical protein